MTNPQTAANVMFTAIAASTRAGPAMRSPSAEIPHAASSRPPITNQQSQIANPHGYADLQHYQKIIVALRETIRLMAAIDQTIETQGGWPGAFDGTGAVNRGDINA
jgi:hypothetical protein